MKNKKYLFLIAVTAFFVSSATAAVSITSFGNTSTPVFNYAPAFSTLTSFSQNGGSADIQGTGALVLSGDFATVDISSVSSQLTISGSVTFDADSSFQIWLYDLEDDYAIYDGGLWSQISTNGISTLSFSSSVGSVNFAEIYALDVRSGGAGGDGITATLTGLSAVPEPTVAMLVGLAGLAGVALRRRRIS